MYYLGLQVVTLDAVLEQDGHVIAYAYANRILSHAERQCRVIEWEWLAVLYAVKQFRYYLLGQPFILHKTTNHYSGGQLNRWRLSNVVGLCRCRNLISHQIPTGFL